MYHKLVATAAWLSLAFIAFATLSPIGLRPQVGGPGFEHLAAFAVTGLLFGLAYPRSLVPVIVLACTIGAYGVNNNPFDIFVMLGFGLFGYLADKAGYSTAPLVLAFVLGPMMETSLRQSLILSQGAFGIFVSRPISAALLALALIVALVPLMRRLPGVRALTWVTMSSRSRK